MKDGKIKRALAIGLTGGIGSGKTEVGMILESMGAYFIQADLVARDLINTDESVKRKVRSVFGSEVYHADGMLDRQQIGKRIFGNQSLQNKINQIVHPPVIEYIERELDKQIANPARSLIVVEAALIYEARIESMFDYTVVVDADAENRIVRLMKRDGRNREEILKRFQAQLSQGSKISKADFVIYNSGSLQSLKPQCEFMFKLFSTISNSNASSQLKGV